MSSAHDTKGMYKMGIFFLLLFALIHVFKSNKISKEKEYKNKNKQYNTKIQMWTSTQFYYGYLANEAHIWNQDAPETKSVCSHLTWCYQ